MEVFARQARAETAIHSAQIVHLPSEQGYIELIPQCLKSPRGHRLSTTGGTKCIVDQQDFLSYHLGKSINQRISSYANVVGISCGSKLDCWAVYHVRSTSFGLGSQTTPS